MTAHGGPPASPKSCGTAWPPMRAALRSSTAGLMLALAAASLAGCVGAGPGAGGSGGSDGAAMAEPESGILGGQLDALAPEAVHSLDVGGSGHERLAVVLVLLTNVPSQDLEVNITSPDASRTAERDTSPFLYVYPGVAPVASFGAPEPGAWTAIVRLAGDAPLAEYELHWCADSGGRPGDQGNRACQRNH